MAEYEKMYAVLCCAIDDAFRYAGKSSGCAEYSRIAPDRTFKSRKYICRKQQLAVKLRGRRLPAASEFYSKFPLSYMSAVSATTGAVSHLSMRAPIEHT